MKIKEVSLEHVLGVTSAIPDTDLPQIAFSGRSNVGKSSLINGLLNRKSLARVSASPGKTRTINFYNVNGEIHFVDLPGYGFANVPESVKEQWGKMIDRYLSTSKLLKKVFILVDIRHEPSPLDKQMYDWAASYGHDVVIIATKADKIKKSRLLSHLKMLKEGLGLKKDVPLIAYSSLTKEGREEIMDIIDGQLNSERIISE
ncbi:MAG: YihA family ribosome biogenesis GTP-binding protein [Lachnospiraceae bacterium]|nr:YihA family ribosome biogenesis GTP-binding protein [Lachnospiraceae bacterium]